MKRSIFIKRESKNDLGYLPSVCGCQDGLVKESPLTSAKYQESTLKSFKVVVILSTLLWVVLGSGVSWGQTTYSTATSSCSAAGNSYNIIQTISGGQRAYNRYSNADFGGSLPSSVLINQIGFSICTAANPSSYTIQDFTVQLREVTSGNCFIGSGGTVVYSGNFTINGTGWQDITLDNIFNWSNTANFLEVTICFPATQTGTTAPAINAFVGTSACRGRTSGPSTNCSSSPLEGTLTSKSSLRLITPGPCSIPTNITSLSGTGDNTIANLSWATPGCFNDEVLVVAQAGSPVVATPSGDGSAYTANLNFGSGTAFGSGFVVYKGLTSPQTITGLANGTTYYFKVFSRLGTNWSSGVEIQVTPFEYIQTAIQATLSPTSHPFFNSAGTWEDFRFNSTYTQAQLGNPGTVNLSRIAWYVRSTAGSSPVGTYQNFTIKLKSTPTLSTSFQTGTTDYSIGTVEINPTTTSNGTWIEFVIDPPLTWNSGEYLYVETCYDNPNGSPVGNNSILVARTGVNYYYGRSAGGTNQTGCSQGFSTGSSATDVPALKIALAPSGCTEPTTNATNFSNNSVGSSTGNVSFTRGDGDGGVLVVARSGGAVNADPDPGTSYTANSTFGSGDEIGTGNFVVYNGSAAGINNASGNIPISGLSAETSYHFAVYEYNSAGTCYSTSPLTGSFVTDCNLPTDITGLNANGDNAQALVSWSNSTCYDEVMIVVKEGASVTGTPTGDGSAYTANLTFGNGTAFGGGFVAYKGDASPQTISGLVNGTTYYVKVFTRKGSNWSSGVEVTVVPIPYYQAGTTTGTMDQWPQANPFFNSSGTWEDYRVGSWYTQAQFGINGTIELDRIGWYIKQATGSEGNYQNFTIKLKSLSQACDGNFQTGTTPVSSSATVTINSSNPQEAWLEFVLSTPFVWNQGDFLYVETCYDNSSAVGNNAIQVAGFSAPSTGYVRSGGGSGSGCSQLVSTASCSGVHLPSLRIAGSFRYHYRTAQSGNWSSASTWEVSVDGVNNWIAATTAPDNTQNTITIRNGHTVSVSASVTVDEVTVEAGGTLQLNSAVTFTVNNGAGTDLDIVGSFIQSDGILTNNGSIVVKDGGLFRQAKVGTAIPNATWETGSTCEVTGWTTALGGGINQSFSNFTWNCAGQSTFIVLEPTSMSVGNLFKVESTGSTNQLLVLGNGSTARSLTVGALEISGGHFAVSGIQSTVAMAMTVSGDYTQSGGLLDVNRNNSSGSTLTIGGNATISGGSTRIQNNGGTSGVISTLTINGNLSVAGGVLDLNPTTIGGDNGRLFIKGDLIQSSGSILYTRGTGSTPTIGSAGIYFDGTGTQSVILSGGTLSTASGGIGRRFYYKTSSGPTAINETYSHTAFQVTVNGSEGTNLPSGYAPWPTSGSLINNVTINNSNGVLMSTNKQVNGILALDNGQLNIQTHTLAIAGSVTRTSGSIDGDQGVLEFMNAAEIAIPVSAIANNGDVNQLRMNGSGGIVLGQAVQVTNSLTLTNGIIDLGVNDLTLTPGTTGSLSGGNGSSFVKTSSSGALRRGIGGIGVYDFPVGEPFYAPLTIDLTAGTFSSSTIAVFTKDVKVPDLNVNHIEYLERHWGVDPTGITSPVYEIRYNYDQSDLILSNSSEADLVPIKKSGGNWYKPQNVLFPDGIEVGLHAVDPNTNLLTWIGLSDFSLFGATINVATPLPIELVSFSAQCEIDQSRLFEWQTASEHNNDFFTIERSEDGISWGIIATIDGVGNSTQLIDYSYSYRPESEEIGDIHYYRLKQTDYDGAFEYSGIISLSCDAEWLSYFTNPVQGTTIEGVLVSQVESSAKVSVYSSIGQLVGNQELSIKKGANLITIPNQQLNQGIYLVRILIDNEVFTHKIMVNN